jgi:protoporphyrinogen oxidase
MPIKDLINAFDNKIPTVIRELAQELPYRDFLTVGILINKKLNLVDNWIYIQEPDVKMGRIQIFNNWSSGMVADTEKMWLGLEYFCTEGDELWSMSDSKLYDLATQELVKLGFVCTEDVIDGVVVRVEKAYPAYWGAYDQFDVLKNYLDKYKNLFLIGRNGMHRYNNQDHSMLAAMIAVDLVRNWPSDKEVLWQVNAEKEYHEIKNA